MENSGPEFQVINICCIHRYFCEYFRPRGRFQAPIKIKTQAEQLGTIKLSLLASIPFNSPKHWLPGREGVLPPNAKSQRWKTKAQARHAYKFPSARLFNLHLGSRLAKKRGDLHNP